MGFFSRKKEKKDEPEPADVPAETAEEHGTVVRDPEPAPKTSGPYFVSPHPEGGWQVKKAKATKALRRFDTKAEAEAYAKQVAKNQGTTVVRMKKDGKIQKKK